MRSALHGCTPSPAVSSLVVPHIILPSVQYSLDTVISIMYYLSTPCTVLIFPPRVLAINTWQIHPCYPLLTDLLADTPLLADPLSPDSLLMSYYTVSIQILYNIVLQHYNIVQYTFTHLISLISLYYLVRRTSLSPIPSHFTTLADLASLADPLPLSRG